MSDEEKKDESENNPPEESDSSSSEEPNEEELTISYEVISMVNIGRFEGIPRARFDSLMNILPEMKPAMTDEIHQKTIDSITRKHGEKQGSAATDLKQIRAIISRYKENIISTIPGLYEYIEQKLALFPQLLKHMEDRREEWEKLHSKSAGNVKFVKELSK